MKNRSSKTSTDEMPADVAHLEKWSRARRTVDPTAVKIPAKRITINLDADIVAVFKAEALRGGPPYQVAINQALRSFLRERETAAEEKAVQTVLAALDDQRVRRKLRRIR